MENKNGRIVAAVVIGVIAITGGAVMMNQLAKQINSVSYFNLVRMTSQVAKTLPMLVDKETELYAVGAEDKAIRYNYRLVNHAKSDITLDPFVKAIKPGIINGNCSNPETRKGLLEKGVAMKYEYYDSSKVFIVELVVTSADCTGPG